MNVAIKTTPTNTTNAEPTNSSRDGQETCFNSSLTLTKKVATFCNGLAIQKD